MDVKLPPAEREHAIRDLQHAASLLHLPERGQLNYKNAVWVSSARSNILSALRLLFELPGLPATCISVCELILKAEVALAAVDVSAVDLSVRIADGLLVQARARIEGFVARED
jgi:hypothetical protein